MSALKELYSDKKDILFELKNTDLPADTKSALKKSLSKINVEIAALEKGNGKFFNNAKIAKGATMSMRQKQAATAKKSSGATAPKEAIKNPAGFTKKGLSKKAKAKLAAEQAAAQKPKAKTPKAKAVPKPKTPKAPKTFSGKYVPMIDEESNLMKKLLSIGTKDVAVEKMESVIRAISKAMTEKRIRKTSKNGEFIYAIYENLVNKVNKMNNAGTTVANISLTKEAIDKMKEIVGNVKVSPAVALLKQYIGFEGNSAPDRTLAKWLKSAKAIKDDVYQKELNDAIKSVENAIQYGNEVEFTKAQLHGLQGLGLIPDQDEKKKYLL